MRTKANGIALTLPEVKKMYTQCNNKAHLGWNFLYDDLMILVCLRIIDIDHIRFNVMAICTIQCEFVNLSQEKYLIASKRARERESIEHRAWSIQFGRIVSSSLGHNTSKTICIWTQTRAQRQSTEPSKFTQSSHKRRLYIVQWWEQKRLICTFLARIFHRLR